MYDGETVNPTIRNQRYERWWPILVRVLLGVGWVAGFVFLVISNLQPIQQLALAAVAVIMVASSVIVVLGVPWCNPVARLKLGDDVEVNPGSWHYKPEQIEHISFARDPVEDYHDSPLPVPMCEVRIKHRPRGSFRLVVSEADAARLRSWAIAKRITICECDGYRPRP